MDGDTLAFGSNRIPGVVRLEPGVFVLSNHLLDTPWPKVTAGRRSWNGSSPSPTSASRICSHSLRRAAPRASKRSAPTPEATSGARGGARHGSSSAVPTERGHRPSSCSIRAAPVSSSSGASIQAARQSATPLSSSAQAAPRARSGGAVDSLGCRTEPAPTDSERKEARDEP